MGRRRHTSVDTFQDCRRDMFNIHNQNGMNKALRFLNKMCLHPAHIAGLKAELIYYDKYAGKRNLIPTLDCGERADFISMAGSGRRLIDVTSNIATKGADIYTRLRRTRGFVYEVAHVNLIDGTITHHPVDFPICEACGKLSHNIIYLVDEGTPRGVDGQISTLQAAIKYCPHCDDATEGQHFNYNVESPGVGSAIASAAGDEDAGEVFNKLSNSAAAFFQKIVGQTISAVGESRFIMEGKHDDGTHMTRLSGIHPLVRKRLDDIIESFYMGPFGP